MFFQKRKTPPGPPWWTRWANLWFMNSDQVAFFHSLKQHGSVVLFWIFHQPIFLLYDRMHVKQVLSDRKTRCKYEPSRAAQKALGDFIGHEGILTLNGDRWEKIRTMLDPAMRPEALAAIAETIHWNAQRFASGLLAKRGEVIDPLDRAYEFALQTASQTLFEYTLSSDDMGRLRGCLEDGLNETFERINNPFSHLTRFFSKKKNDLARATAELDAMVQKLFAAYECGTQPERPYRSAVSILVDEHRAGRLTQQEMMDTGKHLFIAGHETTATTIGWLVDRLAARPALYDELREEARLFSQRPIATLGELHHELPKTLAVIQESMRRKSTVNAVLREAVEDDEIGHFHIPKGALIFVPICVMNTDATTQTMPFGEGPHRCWGEHFAMLEIAHCLVQIIAKNIQFELMGIARERIGITRKPDGLRVKVRAT